MSRTRRITSKSHKRKIFMLFLMSLSLLFISGCYAFLSSQLGFCGTLFVNHYENKSIIQSFEYNDSTKFRSAEYIDKIETITLSEQISPPPEYVESLDLGINNRDNVKGYIVKESASDVYDLYIQGDGELIANENSTYLFEGLSGLKTINGLNILDTSNVTNMSYMFEDCSGLTNLDLSNFDTSNVTDMTSMFSGCSSLMSFTLGSDWEWIGSNHGLHDDTSWYNETTWDEYTATSIPNAAGTYASAIISVSGPEAIYFNKTWDPSAHKTNGGWTIYNREEGYSTEEIAKYYVTYTGGVTIDKWLLDDEEGLITTNENLTQGILKDPKEKEPEWTDHIIRVIGHTSNGVVIEDRLAIASSTDKDYVYSVDVEWGAMTFD